MPGSQQGIYFNPQSGGTIARLHFSNEWSSTNSVYGFNFGGAGTIQGVSFDNCSVINNGQSGIFVINPNASSNDIAIQGCVISGNSTSASNTYDGINVQPGVTADMRIVNNRIGLADGLSNTQRYGITFKASAEQSYCQQQ